MNSGELLKGNYIKHTFPIIDLANLSKKYIHLLDFIRIFVF